MTGTEARVCELIALRQRVGLSKYGQSVRANPLNLREWLVHQQEELADALVYCTRAIEELDKRQEVAPVVTQERGIWIARHPAARITGYGYTEEQARNDFADALKGAK